MIGVISLRLRMVSGIEIGTMTFAPAQHLEEMAVNISYVGS